MPEFLINLIIVAVVLIVLGGVVFYIVREKKKGSKCIGCPYANSCGAGNDKCSCGSGNAHS